MKTFYISLDTRMASGLLQFLNLMLYFLVKHYGYDEVEKAVKETYATDIRPLA